MNRLQRLKLVAAMVAIGAGQVQASGFALIEQSASGQGLSYAGAAANAEDASVMWFNPAGLTKIKDGQIIGALHIVKPELIFYDGGSYVNSPVPVAGAVLQALGAAGGSVDGKPSDDGATTAHIPNFYWKTSFYGLDFGFAVNVPFGSHLVQDPNWTGRYHAEETDLKTINLNPAIAKQLTPWLAFGAGLNVQYVDLIMTQKMDNNLLLNTGNPDGNAQITADSLGYGYNWGFMLQPTESTTIGLAYRSSVKHQADGEIEYSGITDLLYSQVGVEDGVVPVHSTVNLPATTMLSIKQEVGNKFAILADATLTEWSQYDELVVDFDSSQDSVHTRQELKDVWRYSLGAIYNPTSSLTLRSGVAVDYTPVKNPENRSPRTPDSDRHWFSVGAGYQMTKSLKLDLAYSYLKGTDSKVDYTTDDVHYLVGDYKAKIDIFSGQLVWNY